MLTVIEALTQATHILRWVVGEEVSSPTNDLLVEASIEVIHVEWWEASPTLLDDGPPALDDTIS